MGYNMNRVFLFAILNAVAYASHAQGYVGAVRSLTSVDFNCGSSSDCDKSSKGWRFYGGVKLAPANVIDLGGIGKIDSVEVAYMRFGLAAANGTRPIINYDGDTDTSTPVDLPVSYRAQADAIAASMVARFPLFDQFSLAGRLGVAYVSSTIKTVDSNGASFFSETATKFKPYIGLSVEYDIPSVVKVVGTLDMTHYDVSGRKGNMRMFGLGAEKSF